MDQAGCRYQYWSGCFGTNRNAIAGGGGRKRVVTLVPKRLNAQLSAFGGRYGSPDCRTPVPLSAVSVIPVEATLAIPGV
jgi:hypothetical protein